MYGRTRSSIIFPSSALRGGKSIRRISTRWRKDIVRFHAVIWPAMLMSAGLPLPGQIIANGISYDRTARRCPSRSAMPWIRSTSPRDMATMRLRYFLLREISFGDDGDFSEDKDEGALQRRPCERAWQLRRAGAHACGEGDRCPTANAVLDGDFDITIETMKRVVYAKLKEYQILRRACRDMGRDLVRRPLCERKESVGDKRRRRARAQALFNLVSLLDAVAASLCRSCRRRQKRSPTHLRGGAVCCT